MSVKTTYKTVQGISEGLYREKGSKFIAYAAPCRNEAEAKALLESWRKAHHQARHLCYAYRFGAEGLVFRANDDGEPGNSAGTPILGQLQSFELTNVLVGVVRYFGGTKLGVGGLVQAYKSAARDAIENGEIIEKQVQVMVNVSFSYAQMPFVLHAIKQLNLDVVSRDLSEKCAVQIALPIAESAHIVEEITSLPSVVVEHMLT
jgi:uncharacterized YigZ family protein